MKTTRKPKPRGSNFSISVNDRFIGGWPGTYPAKLARIVRNFIPVCEKDGIEMDVETAELIMEDFFDSERELDELDGMLVVWWLAQTDPDWPRMLREFGQRTDFHIELSNAHGAPEAIIHRTPTPTLH